MQGFETVRQELDAKRHQLEQELQSAQGKVAEIRADLERVQEALDALVGPKKKAKGGRGRSKKHAATVQDLQRHIARVRAEHPYASAVELRKAVRALVQESGMSVARFPTLFAQALVSSPGFSGGEEQPAGFIPLAQAASSAHSEAPASGAARAFESHGSESHVSESHRTESSPHPHEAGSSESAPDSHEDEQFFNP